MMKSKKLKTKIYSHAHSLILTDWLTCTNPVFCQSTRLQLFCLMKTLFCRLPNLFWLHLQQCLAPRQTQLLSRQYLVRISARSCAAMPDVSVLLNFPDLHTFTPMRCCWRLDAGLAGVLHNSIDSLSFEDEQRKIAELINQFISKVAHFNQLAQFISLTAS